MNDLKLFQDINVLIEGCKNKFKVSKLTSSLGDFIKSGQMKNRFEKYLKYQKENGKIVDVNVDSFILADEAFLLFKTLYDTDYGSIEENDNLISIHTGGWSENEEIIREFEETAWWFMYHKITARGALLF